MRSDLVIAGAGLLTPIGHSAAVCVHSVRSAVSRLTVQGILDRAKEPIAGGRVLRWTSHVRERHLQLLAEIALREAVQKAEISHEMRIAVLLGSPEERRPGYKFPPAGFDVERWSAAQIGGRIVHVDVMPAGAVSGPLGLHRATELLRNGTADACVVGAADTQLQLRVVRWHEDHYRLKCSYMTDGLLPGEAACFLVVESEAHARDRGVRSLARILSVAGGRESATVLGEEPNTATTLTEVVRTALSDAEIGSETVGMVWSDLNGESYKAREWALAEIRMRFRADTMLIHPADCHGDLGAATGVNLLALAALAHDTGWSEGRPLLVFCGSDEGLRAAAILTPSAQRRHLQVSIGSPRILSHDFKVPSEPTEHVEFSEQVDPPREYFEWELREEHRDELASLHYQRRALVNDATIPWRRLREPEQRMLNHLDAAIASGPRSIACAAAGLETEEEGLNFAGAFIIGTLPGGDNFDRIGKSLTNPSEGRLTGIGSALLHIPASDTLHKSLTEWIRTGHPAVQAMSVSVAGLRRMDVTGYLPRVDLSSPPRLSMAVANACRRLGLAAAAQHLRLFLDAEDPDVRRAAILSLLVLAPEATLAYVRSSLPRDSTIIETLAICVAVGGKTDDASVLMREYERNPSDLALIEALGILGAPSSIPFLVALLASKELAVREAAADAIELMSGITAAVAGETFATAEIDQWWANTRHQVRIDARVRRGQRFDLGMCIDEIEDARSGTRARERAALEIAVHSGRDVPFEPYWFVPLQLAGIERLRTWWLAREQQ